MTATELRNHPDVLELIRIQEENQLNDNQFSELLRLRLHGANWGKIKAKTYTGRFERALTNLQVALEDYRNAGVGEVEEGIVILDHVKQSLDAVDIAKANEDEHRFIVLCGVRGSGKSRTLRLIQARHKGSLLSARPSWNGGYLNFLNRFASGLNLPESRSAGEAEESILAHMKASPGRVLCIDEFNYFSSNAVGFIKTILNETTWIVMVATVPFHLNRMASDRSTAQESAQLLRRAVAIIHIHPISPKAVELLCRALFPALHLAGKSAEIAAKANTLDRWDSVCQILEDIDPEDPADISKAIVRHERFHRTNIQPGTEAA